MISLSLVLKYFQGVKPRYKSESRNNYKSSNSFFTELITGTPVTSITNKISQSTHPCTLRGSTVRRWQGAPTDVITDEGMMPVSPSRCIFSFF